MYVAAIPLRRDRHVAGQNRCYGLPSARTACIERDLFMLSRRAAPDANPVTYITACCSYPGHKCNYQSCKVPWALDSVGLAEQ